MHHFPAWHNLILSRSRLWLCPSSKPQPSISRPRPQLIAPRSLLISSRTPLMPEAIHSPVVKRWPTQPQSCLPFQLHPPVSSQHKHFWAKEKTNFLATVSRDIHFLSLGLVISLMMWTSCQLSSNWNSHLLAWLFFPSGNRDRNEIPPISAYKKTEILYCSQSLNKHCWYFLICPHQQFFSRTKGLAFNRVKGLAWPNACL